MEEFLVIDEVRELRQRLCKKIFQKLMRELSSSLTCLVNLTENRNIYEIQEQNLPEDHSFKVSFDSEMASWSCECRLSEKIGIPCSHIIKVMLLSRQKIITGINRWWLLNESAVRSPQVNVRFPRKTRRNQ